MTTIPEIIINGECVRCGEIGDDAKCLCIHVDQNVEAPHQAGACVIDSMGGGESDRAPSVRAVSAALEAKADRSALSELDAKKADKAETSSLEARKADKSTVIELYAQKADKADLEKIDPYIYRDSGYVIAAVDGNGRNVTVAAPPEEVRAWIQAGNIVKLNDRPLTVLAVAAGSDSQTRLSVSPALAAEGDVGRTVLIAAPNNILPDAEVNRAGIVSLGQIEKIVQRHNEDDYAHAGLIQALRDEIAALREEMANPSYVAVESIAISPTSVDKIAGETQQLTATIVPVHATIDAVVWSSSNPAIATVDANGLVTCRSAGSVMITASAAADNSKTAVCDVTVTPATIAVTGISVSPVSVTKKAGETQQLTATVAPAIATNQNVNWSSNNTGIATVSATGLVTCKAAGIATITATAADRSGQKATCLLTVEVVDPVSVSVSPVSISVGPYGSGTFTADVWPPMAQYDIKWELESLYPAIGITVEQMIRSQEEIGNKLSLTAYSLAYVDVRATVKPKSVNWGEVDIVSKPVRFGASSEVILYD